MCENAAEREREREREKALLFYSKKYKRDRKVTLLYDPDYDAEIIMMEYISCRRFKYNMIVIIILPVCESCDGERR